MPASRTLSTAAAVLLLHLASPACGESGDGTAPWRRDPFRYKGTLPVAGVDQTGEPDEVSEELPLKGIVLGEDGRYRALIDNRECQAGDLCAGVRIREVTRFTVIVEDAGGIRKVGLFHER